MRLDSDGFTLIELIVTLTIMTVAIMIVVPTFKQIFLGMEIKSAIRRMYADLYFAKISAKQNHKTYCAVIKKETDKEWLWQVIEDTNNDGCDDSTDTILKNLSILKNYPSITKINNNTIQTDNYNFIISFDSQGLARTNNGTISLEIEQNNYSRDASVSISPAGFIHITQ